MSKATEQVLDVDKLEVVADRGYFSSKEILECTNADVTVTLPKPQASNNKRKGLFVKADFRYVSDQDQYICPAGEELVFISHKRDGAMNLRRYATRQCGACHLRKRCTNAVRRVVPRWEHEDVLEDVQRRLDENPKDMRARRETVEHPFGMIKSRMGATHLQMKRLHNVKTEMSLAVLAYNLTRAMNIIGTKKLIAGIRAFLRLTSSDCAWTNVWIAQTASWTPICEQAHKNSATVNSSHLVGPTRDS